jgi:flagellar protein FliL
MSDTLNETSTENTPEGKKGGKKKLIIIALILVLLGGSVGGGVYYWRTASAAEPAEETADGKKPKGKKNADGEEGENEIAKKEPKKPGDPLSNALPDDEDVTNIIELQPFIVNLADTEQARYLRMTISLGVAGEGEEEKPDQLFITRVRNAMLSVLSDKRSEDILTVDGKSKLRTELLKAAKAASEEPEVKAIYITDFIVQL